MTAHADSHPQDRATPVRNTWAGTVLSTLPALSLSLPGGEAYKVRVRFKRPLLLPEHRRVVETGGNIALTRDRRYVPVDPSKMFTLCRVSGAVHTDGTLNITPEPWRAKYYWRAVMGGAGVYRWGLRAHPLNQRTLTTPQNGRVGMRSRLL